jgi:hypothetical protein
MGRRERSIHSVQVAMPSIGGMTKVRAKAPTGGRSEFTTANRRNEPDAVRKYHFIALTKFPYFDPFPSFRHRICAIRRTGLAFIRAPWCLFGAHPWRNISGALPDQIGTTFAKPSSGLRTTRREHAGRPVRRARMQQGEFAPRHPPQIQDVQAATRLRRSFILTTKPYPKGACYAS